MISDSRIIIAQLAVGSEILWVCMLIGPLVALSSAKYFIEKVLYFTN